MLQSRHKLAVWDAPAAEFFLAGLTSGAVELPLEVERGTPRTCEEMLRAGAVDIAMLPTVRALQMNEDYDVLSAVALVSWEYPYARLVLKNGLRGRIRTVASHPDDVQDAFLAKVILKEHYDMEPDFVAAEGGPREVLEGGEDAALLVGNDVPTVRTEGLSLDLGQEWYELANYPMVWGLFAVRKGEGSGPMIKTLRSAAEAAEEQRDVWVQAREMPEGVHSFFKDALRLRLDRLAIASLTELEQFLFYYNLADDVPEVPFVYLEDEEDEESSGEGDSEILL